MRGVVMLAIGAVAWCYETCTLSLSTLFLFSLVQLTWVRGLRAFGMVGGIVLSWKLY